MQVSKSSWHYKWFRFTTYMSNYFQWNLHKYSDESIKYTFEEMLERDPHTRNSVLPKTICQYWRAVIIWPLVKAIINLSAVALGIFLIFKFPWVSFMVICFLTLVVVGSAVLISLIVILDWMLEEQRVKRGKPKRNGLIISAIKAQNDKICTIMEYEDD